jgi:tetratricopeptide (TPR) repeat protein
MVGQSLNDLAELYCAQGRYAEAEALHQRALRIRAQVLGATHPYVEQSLNDLARIYDRQKHYAEAESLYQRALRIWEHALGPTHPEVARGLNNLANLYRDQKRNADAEPLYQRALHIREEVLEQVAIVCMVHLQYSRSMKPYSQDLRDRLIQALEAGTATQGAIGPTHPAVAGSLSGLVGILAQSHPAQARAPYERARRLYLTVARVNIDLDDEALRGLAREGHGTLRAYATLLARLARTPQADVSTTSPAWDAFVVAEQRRRGAAQAALTRAGARAAAGDPVTAQLARQVQELRDQRQAARKALTAEYDDMSATAPDPARMKQLQQEESTIDRALVEATERLHTAFPTYGHHSSWWGKGLGQH